MVITDMPLLFCEDSLNTRVKLEITKAKKYVFSAPHFLNSAFTCVRNKILCFSANSMLACVHIKLYVCSLPFSSKSVLTCVCTFYKKKDQK